MIDNIESLKEFLKHPNDDYYNILLELNDVIVVAKGLSSQKVVAKCFNLDPSKLSLFLSITNGMVNKKPGTYKLNKGLIIASLYKDLEWTK